MNYSGVLFYGEAWHNINNMWWVICNGRLYNIAAFELFDYQGEPVRRGDKRRAADKIRKLISKHSKAMEFEKCVVLKSKLEKILEVPE